MEILIYCDFTLQILEIKQDDSVIDIANLLVSQILPITLINWYYQYHHKPDLTNRLLLIDYW